MNSAGGIAGYTGCADDATPQRQGPPGAPDGSPDLGIFCSRYLQVMRYNHLDGITTAARERAEITDQEWREVAEGWSENAEDDLVGAGVHSRPGVSHERFVGLVGQLSHPHDP